MTSEHGLVEAAIKAALAVSVMRRPQLKDRWPSAGLHCRDQAVRKCCHTAQYVFDS